MNSFFSNNFWPAGCIYNISSTGSGTCEGGAEVEHHFTEDGKRNVWLQKGKEKVETSLIDYYEWAKTRCSNSD